MKLLRFWRKRESQQEIKKVKKQIQEVKDQQPEVDRLVKKTKDQQRKLEEKKDLLTLGIQRAIEGR